MMLPTTNPGQPGGQYASRVPTLAQQQQQQQQQPPLSQHAQSNQDRPTIPGLPLQRLPMGALASKVVGPGQPGAQNATGTSAANMQRGLIDSMNLKQAPPVTPFVKQKVRPSPALLASERPISA